MYMYVQLLDVNDNGFLEYMEASLVLNPDINHAFACMYTHDLKQ